MMADLSFFSFGSLAGRMAADTSGAMKLNTVSMTFEAVEMRNQTELRPVGGGCLLGTGFSG